MSAEHPRRPRRVCDCGTPGAFVRESTYTALLSGRTWLRETYRCPADDCAVAGWSTSIGPVPHVATDDATHP